MRKKKQQPIEQQGPWLIISYSSVKNKGEEDEFDEGYIEFNHQETGIKILKEMSWLRGEGAYKEKKYNTPTLPEVWDTFLKNTPGTTGFIYKNWHINRDHNCFIYILADPSESPPGEIHKNIIGDFVSQKQDFASFLEMLDNIEISVEEEKPKQLFDLGEARMKRDAM